MVSSHAGFVLRCQPQVLPSERGFVNIETPDIVDRLSTSVSSEHEQVRFAEHNRVTISTTRCSSDNGYDHPLGSGISISQIEQIEIIRGQTTAYKKVKEQFKPYSNWGWRPCWQLFQLHTYLRWLRRRLPFGVSRPGNCLQPHEEMVRCPILQHDTIRC